VGSAKIVITIDQAILTRLDRMVKEGRFANRSRAVGEALSDKLEPIDHGRLARECAKLHRKFEQQVVEEGLTEDLKQWPEC
jgi:metal-responsive CopG/Arc/MetJ family transcriptional regulator